MHMRKTLLAVTCLLAAHFAGAQTPIVANFDSLPLPGPDTFYENYTQPGVDVGFGDGIAYFPSVFDTSGGFQYWAKGFSYSNQTDTTTAGFLNDHSPITGKAFNGNQFCVYYQGDGNASISIYTGGLITTILNGFEVTNSTYAYLSMRDGDGFAKKFGGASGDDTDFFKMMIIGYRNGTKTGKVEHYLADFRFADNSLDYIQNDWQWVDCTPLGYVDSVKILFASSDSSFGFINTPTYACIDSLVVQAFGDNIASVPFNAHAKTYPNPATDFLFLESDEPVSVTIHDAAGKVIFKDEAMTTNRRIISKEWASGVYFLKMNTGTATKTIRISKQ